MKITGKKNIEAERLRGRAAIDAVYVPKINAAMGPKFALYQLKALDATAGYDTFGDPATIIEKHTEFMGSIATIESERQAYQAKVDAATTASEVDAIIAAL